ncbi:uncharacterized protein BDZ99DRAFT_470824 [Mytilinidion resinicola]|uniref:Uncharacterized protein n=1 Tax=Mytilinidion resinicola TaxID=574789 RepID=A0A6A6ZB06_9PEZI|nr:uncharacterized protein BDZ99DRAFT_470824 [Mytilinidion resinicola]KAF2817879.1 hypothetical protein BDZ99DRAFT_470824 [Mytilinidion resinicola]
MSASSMASPTCAAEGVVEGIAEGREEELAPQQPASTSSTESAGVVRGRTAKGHVFSASVYRKRETVLHRQLSKGAPILHISKRGSAKSSRKSSAKCRGRSSKANMAASDIIDAVAFLIRRLGIPFPWHGEMAAELRMMILNEVFRKEKVGILQYVKTSPGASILTVSGDPTPVISYRTMLRIKSFFESGEVERRFWALVSHFEGDWADIVRLYKPAASATKPTTLPAGKIQKVVVPNFESNISKAQEAIALLESSPKFGRLVFAGKVNDSWDQASDFLLSGLADYLENLAGGVGAHVANLNRNLMVGFEGDYGGVYTKNEAEVTRLHGLGQRPAAGLDAATVARRCRRLDTILPVVLGIFPQSSWAARANIEACADDSLWPA